MIVEQEGRHKCSVGLFLSLVQAAYKDVQDLLDDVLF